MNIPMKISVARRILFREGSDSQIAGHVSCRAPGEESFYVTPFEYFDETVPERVLRVAFDMRVLQGDLPASPGIGFHASIYRARPDAQAIVHHHAHWTSVLATTGRVLGQFNLVASLFHGDQVISQNPMANGEELVALLGRDKHVVLIRNHGVVIIGRSLEEVTVKALMFEKLARIHLDAMAAKGAEIEGPVIAELRAAIEQVYVGPMWEANVRRLRRSDPDLFERREELSGR